MPLSDITVWAAKAGDKPRKLHDERGPYLLITASGKYWRLDYRYRDRVAQRHLVSPLPSRERVGERATAQAASGFHGWGCRLRHVRLGGKRKTLALGVYPEVSLSEARQKRDDARRETKAGN